MQILNHEQKKLMDAHCQILLIILLQNFIKLNVNIDMTIKNVKRVESNTKSLDASLNIQTFKIVYKYLYSNKNYQKVLMKFIRTDFQFILLLQTGVYMDHWEKFNETLLPEKKDSYGHLNMEDITDTNYAHARKFVKTLKYKTQVNIMIYMFKVIYMFIIVS